MIVTKINGMLMVSLEDGLAVGIYLSKSGKLIDAPFEKLRRHDDTVRYCRVKQSPAQWQRQRLYQHKAEIYGLGQDLEENQSIEWDAPNASQTVTGEATVLETPMIEDPEKDLLSISL